ncbi:alpha/beta fold hydrolase [Glycomyces buryatensis]|uniref:Alpha/beta hydrolase n=1 Tax=Glycomyces buryatensis TaxID=2570927 RepID=A0A4S8QNB3_9ACTN|nr:alpha/beta hydrolase [Glycomyces buryatensis]THV42214.1 alpha/beta hydrolase [Glycomyces buryatensis]
MPTIPVGTSRVQYTVTGSGPTLMLVHGVGKGGQSAFGHLVDEFAKGHTVILADLSGSEAAEDDGGALTIEQQAAEVAAIIDDSGFGPVDLVGFSLGGAVVAAAAALYPEKVRRLVPLGGLVKADAYMKNLVGLTLSQKHDPLAFGRVLTTTAFSPAFINTLPSLEEVDKMGAELSPSSGRIRQLELLIETDISDIVGKVQAPTLVVAANPDGAVPTHHSRELHAAIPNAEYVELDSGHMMLFEKPEESVKLINDFIGQN